MESDSELLALARDIYACCHLRGEFVLRSGKTTGEYFDKYLFEADPRLLRRVVERMLRLVPPGTELLAGLELGGVSLAIMLSALTGLPALQVRKRAKEYGTRKLAEGPDPEGHTVLLVEDVITTGGAVLAAAEGLRSLGALVTDVVCAIDRTTIDGDVLAPAGVTIRSVLTKDMLDVSSR